MSFLKFETIILVFKSVLKFFSSKKNLLAVSLFIFSLLAHFIFVFHSQKTRWLKIHKKPDKQTLQRAEGPLVAEDQDIRVLKVKHKDKIYLEFLAKQPDNSFMGINSIQLKGSREAFFDYGGEMASLIILDEDGDGKLDILAPAFDKFFRPQLNLAFYNQRTKKFELKKTGNYPQVVPAKSWMP